MGDLVLVYYWLENLDLVPTYTSQHISIHDPKIGTLDFSSLDLLTMNVVL